MSEFLYAEPRPDLLETFENPHPSAGLRDHARRPGVHQRLPQNRPPGLRDPHPAVRPDRERCVELKSLKLYYQSFRNHGAFYEAVTNEIADVLIGLLEPKELELVADWTPRGGLHSTIRVAHAAPESSYEIDS